MRKLITALIEQIANLSHMSKRLLIVMPFVILIPPLLISLYYFWHGSPFKDDITDWTALIGAPALVVAAIIIMLWREHSRNQKS
jgi:hypothetical protein